MMLTIRREQQKIFALEARRRFEDEMLPYLHRHHERLAAAMGDQRLRELVRAGVDKAERYGIHIAEDVCRIVNLMCVLGRNFDTDPELPWASHILNDPSFNHGSDRARYLYERAQQHMRGR